MAGITLAIAEAKLTLALAALDKVLEAQEYAIQTGEGARSAKMAELEDVQASIDYWEAKVCKLSRGTSGGLRYANKASQ